MSEADRLEQEYWKRLCERDAAWKNYEIAQAALDAALEARMAIEDDGKWIFYGITQAEGETK